MIDVEKEILGMADPKYKEFNEKLVPGIRKSYGVRVPQLRELAKRLIKDDWRSFLASERRSLEEDLLHGLVIANAKMDIDERMHYIKEFVPTIDNWEVCDIFCGRWKLKSEESEILWDYCNELMESDAEFEMRFATVMMMANYMDEDHVEQILELMKEKYHPGYYYKMGAAWCISTCYIKYPDITIGYLGSGELDLEILSKSIQKICDSYRVNDEDKNTLRMMKKDILNRYPRSS